MGGYCGCPAARGHSPNGFTIDSDPDVPFVLCVVNDDIFDLTFHRSSATVTDNPTHRWIASQTVGVVDVLIATEAAEDGLPKQSRHRVLAVLACARIDQFITNHVRQPECVIELTVGKQSGVGGDPGTVKLKLQATVEIEPENAVV
jgi:hypothetical protein